VSVISKALIEVNLSYLFGLDKIKLNISTFFDDSSVPDLRKYYKMGTVLNAGILLVFTLAGKTTFCSFDSM
jgi:hypothetical protein